MTKPPKSKIYTRTGDTGFTKLISGKRVRKDDPKTTAYGSLDELNSILGVATSFIRDKKIAAVIQNIQNELFNIGAEIAGAGKFHIDATKIEGLEQLIDCYDQNLTNLETFILPTGKASATFLHQARTVCRRTEREVVNLARKEKINPNLIAYLNRLGDLLFVLARYLNKKAGRREISWAKN